VAIRGTIKSFDAKSVTIIDEFGQMHVEDRASLPKEQKFAQGHSISWLKKVSFNALTKATISAGDVSKLSPELMATLHRALIDFGIDNDTYINSTLPPKIVPEKKVVQTDSFMQFVDWLIPRSWATATLNCLYAGWPSIMSSGSCLPPWNQNARAAGATYQPCGNDNAFRCNPELFGDGFDVSGVSANKSVLPYTGSSVRIFSRAPVTQGICVDAPDRSSLTEKCLQASRDRLPQVIERMQENPAIYDRMLATINSYCNAQRSFAGRNGCAALNQRLSEIRFAATQAQPVCHVVANANNSDCPAPGKSILVKCHKGGEVYQGHLRAQDITSAIGALAVGAAIPSTSALDLYRGQCGEGAKINDFNQCTTLVQEQGSPTINARLSLGSGGGSNPGTCQGETCIVNSNCLGTPVDGGTDGNGDIYNVTMVCACNQLPGGADVTDAAIIRACGVDQSLPLISSGQGLINTGDELKASGAPR
jgi:hypothetical protein